MTDFMSEALRNIQQRCEAAGLEHEAHEAWEFTHEDLGLEEGDEPLDDLPGQAPYVVVRIPRGRTTSPFVVEDGPQAAWAVNEPFEEFRMLTGYDATWSTKHRVIECELKPAVSPETVHNSADKADFLKAVLDILDHVPDGRGGNQSEDLERRAFFDSQAGCTLSVGESSNTHALLTGASFPDTPSQKPEKFVDRALTLRIEGVEASTHDDALEVLERVGNSLLFHIDSWYGLPLVLDRQKDWERWWSDEGLVVGNDEGEYLEGFEAPDALPPVRFEYDRNPMSLYWYAKAASEMPLLRFLAYYQMIEFYFPVYSEVEAQRTLRNVLKEPTFNPMRDSDIARLLDAIKVGPGGRTFGNEASQLEATIRHCVTAEDLRGFLIEGNEDRYKFYTSDNAKKVVRERIPIREKADDHRGAAAKRIYALRNRIVHTKGAHGDQEPLFPFDPEVKYLRHDIDLTEFLARKVLIASSRPLQI